MQISQIKISLIILLISIQLITGCESKASAIVAVREGYTVTEWGLIDVFPNGSARLQTTPNGNVVQARRPSSSPGRSYAPIIYFDIMGTTETYDIHTRVHATGTVTEHWPPASLEQNTINWGSMRISRQSCQGTYPLPWSSHCRHVEDNYCEATALRAAETTNSACIQYDCAQYNHLFYRSEIPNLNLPIAIDRSNNTINIRRISSDLLYDIIRVTHDGPSIHAITVSPPSINQNQIIPPALSGGTQASQQALREGMMNVGVRGEPLEAFFRVWNETLFGAQAKQDALLFVLPPALTNQVSLLEFSPQPLRIDRGFVVRISLSDL